MRTEPPARGPREPVAGRILLGSPQGSMALPAVVLDSGALPAIVLDSGAPGRRGHSTAVFSRPLWGRVLAAQDSHPPRHTSGVPPRSWPGARGISVGQEGAAQSWGQGLGGPPLNFFCVFLAPLTPEGAKCRPGIHETDAECESGEQAMVWPARRGPWVCGVCSRRPRGSPGSALSRVSRARFSDNMGWLGAWRGGSERDPPPRSWGVIKLIIRSVGLGVNKQMKNRGRSW